MRNSTDFPQENNFQPQEFGPIIEFLSITGFTQDVQGISCRRNGHREFGEPTDQCVEHPFHITELAPAHVSPNDEHTQEFTNDIFLFPCACSELDGAQCVAVSSSGKDIFVAASSAGTLVQLCANETNSNLVAVDAIVGLDGASSVGNMTKHACKT